MLDFLINYAYRLSIASSIAQSQALYLAINSSLPDDEGGGKT
ncbi:MAG TPA: hypothetical protein PKA00_02865 [Saprospiraceae bacterium]|nr:hypothetical protein [Saprospiraceae bacterium]HMQ81816.1 hypothetical protein [Saprospiraceae bacterium]